MLLLKVCDRACDAIIDELLVNCLEEKYPANLTILIDGLICLSEFEWQEYQLQMGRQVSDGHAEGSRLAFLLMVAASEACGRGDDFKAQKYSKLLARMCASNARFSRGFVSFVDQDDGDLESIRFELGGVAADICAAVRREIDW